MSYRSQLIQTAGLMVSGFAIFARVVLMLLKARGVALQVAGRHK